MFVLCKAKNYDPSYAWGSTVHWSTWDLRLGVWPASAVWRARCVTVICKTNRQKLEQIIRYPARASYNTFTRKQMTNLQLTTGRSRSQSADHLPASENLENRSCKQLRCWIVWLFLLVQFFSPAQLMQNLLACKFVGNSVLVFSEMRAMESWYINSVCINNIPLPRSSPAWPRALQPLSWPRSTLHRRTGREESKGHSCSAFTCRLRDCMLYGEWPPILDTCMRASDMARVWTRVTWCLQSWPITSHQPRQQPLNDSWGPGPGWLRPGCTSCSHEVIHRQLRHHVSCIHLTFFPVSWASWAFEKLLSSFFVPDDESRK